MSKLTTVQGGLAGLRALALGASRAQRTITEHRKLTSNKRHERWGSVKATGKRCLCCGRKVGASERASVLFSLVNGPQGTVTGPLCSSHSEGDHWRDGTGKITSIAPVKPKPSAEPKALKATKPAPLGYQAPKVWTPPVKAESPQAPQPTQRKLVRSYSFDGGFRMTEHAQCYALLSDALSKALNFVKNLSEEREPRTVSAALLARVAKVSPSTAGKRLLALHKMGRVHRSKVGRSYAYSYNG